MVKIAKDLEKEMSFAEHLEDLRWHVVRSLVVLFIFAIGAFVIAPWVFENIIFAPARVDFPTFQWLCKLGAAIGAEEGFCIKEIPFRLQSRLMTGQFSMHIMASFVIGLIISFPYIVWEFYRFIKPGLHLSERKYTSGAVAAISFLFMSGILFGFYVLCPLMISFLANYQISELIVNEFDISSYVGTIVALLLGTGLLFQLPVFVFFLTKMDIVTPKMMKKKRKHAIVTILIAGAIITPSADPLSQMLISLPLYFLYELSIIISEGVVKRKLKEKTELTPVAVSALVNKIKRSEN